jgi:hypothetical protein
MARSEDDDFARLNYRIHNFKFFRLINYDYTPIRLFLRGKVIHRLQIESGGEDGSKALRAGFDA